MKKIRMAVVGYGQRGSYVTVHSLHHIEEIEVTAVCDLYQDRVDQGVKESEKSTAIRCSALLIIMTF